MAAKAGKSIRGPIWALIVLNLADGIFTWWGLLAGVIEEANPLLSRFSPLTILFIKLALSAFLAAFLFTPFAQSESRKWRVFLLIANAMYIGILALHLTWVAFVYL